MTVLKNKKLRKKELTKTKKKSKLDDIISITSVTKENEEEVICTSPHISRKRKRKSLDLERRQLRSDIKYVYSPSETHSMEINKSDLQCLKPGMCLNDNIINFYITYLFYEKLSETQRNRTYFFNCFFNTKLSGTHSEQETDTAKSRHKRVAKWTKNVDIFEKDFLIIPMIEDEHWFLIIVCFPWMDGMIDYTQIMSTEESPNTDLSKTQANNNEWAKVTRLSKLKAVISQTEQDSHTETPMPCILLFDSLSTVKRTDKIDLIREYLKTEWDIKRASRDGPMVFDKTTMRGFRMMVPLQDNNTDCGMFLLHYVQSFYEDPIRRFTMDYFKKYYMVWIDQSGLEQKRMDILITILNLPQQHDSAIE